MHLTPGLLTALVDFEVDVAEFDRIHTHFNGCQSCQKVLEKIKAYRDKRDSLSPVNGTVTCTANKENQVEFFLAFFSAEVSEDTAANFFEHLNVCFECYDSFSTNWSDYLILKEQRDSGRK